MGSSYLFDCRSWGFWGYLGLGELGVGGVAGRSLRLWLFFGVIGLEDFIRYLCDVVLRVRRLG